MNNQTAPSRPNPFQELAWRVFYVLNCILMFLQVASLPLVENFGIMETIDFAIAIILFAALSGFVFYKPIGNVIFWRYFFYIALCEVALVLVLFPVFKLPLYGVQMSADTWFINLVYLTLNLWALHFYAFKYRFIWVRDEKTD